MPSFFDIKTDFGKDPSDFLLSIPDEIKRNMTGDMFTQAQHLLLLIQKNLRPEPDFPQIKITNSKEISPKGMDGLIELPTGFIAHCLALQSAPFAQLTLDHNSTFYPDKDHPNAFFCWAVAHEYHHGIRKHNIAADVLDSDPATTKALELDADLSATASLFRWYQIALGERYSAVSIKQILFSDLYWAISQLPESLISESHPTDAERLFLILGKVAHIRSNPTDPPDPELSTLESKTSLEALLNILIQLEKFDTTAIHETFPGKRSFAKQLLEVISTRSWGQAVDRWENVRHTVSVASGTKA